SGSTFLKNPLISLTSAGTASSLYTARQRIPMFSSVDFSQARSSETAIVFSLSDAVMVFSRLLSFRQDVHTSTRLPSSHLQSTRQKDSTGIRKSIFACLTLYGSLSPPSGTMLLSGTERLGIFHRLTYRLF